MGTQTRANPPSWVQFACFHLIPRAHGESGQEAPPVISPHPGPCSLLLALSGAEGLGFTPEQALAKKQRLGLSFPISNSGCPRSCWAQRCEEC